LQEQPANGRSRRTLDLLHACRDDFSSDAPESACKLPLRPLVIVRSWRRARLAAVALVVLAGGASMASPATAAPQSYYLALGDSIAFGFQPTKARGGISPRRFDTGYVDVLAARLRTLAPAIQVVNYGCPGESLVTFIRGGCFWLGEGGRLHDSFRGAQLDAALDFLRAHPGQVSPIPVTLWGNDIQGFEERCGNEPRCIRRRAPRALGSMASRLRSILSRLRAAAPDAEIIATGAWNFEVGRIARMGFLYRSLEKRISRAAASTGARVADMRAVFNPRGGPAAVRSRLCDFTFMCSQRDPHPKDKGYRAMADAFFEAAGYPPPP
jgi:lysophospholipase L1-like esterase